MIIMINADKVTKVFSDTIGDSDFHIPVIVEQGQLMLCVAEVWVGTGRVIKIMNNSTDQQSSYLNPLKHLLQVSLVQESHIVI